MDVMQLRRGLMMGMAQNIIPAYLKHAVFEPSEDTRTLSLNVGNAFEYALIASNCPRVARTAETVTSGMVTISAGGIAGTVSRLVTLKTSGGISYYASTSANQLWTYTDGVLTIACTAGWVFGAGIRYDIFYV